MFSGRPRKRSPARGVGIVTFTTMIANGTLAPLFMITKMRFLEQYQFSDPTKAYLEYIPPTKHRNDRRGERGIVAYLEYHQRLKTFKRGDVLISDSEFAMDTELVRDILADMGVIKLTLPRGMTKSLFIINIIRNWPFIKSM